MLLDEAWRVLVTGKKSTSGDKEEWWWSPGRRAKENGDRPDKARTNVCYAKGLTTGKMNVQKNPRIRR